MSTREIVLTVQQGQHFLNYLSGGLRMPEHLGEDKYDVAERSWIDSKLLALKAIIMSYSSRLKKPRGLCFGGVELWEVMRANQCEKCGTAGDAWVMVDQDAEVRVRLNEDAEEGIYWALLLMAHPSSDAAAGILVLAETTWPIAKAMGIDKMLAKDVGLGSKRPRRILSNDEMEKVQEPKKAEPEAK